MAKVKKNVVVQGISGKIGELVFRQMPSGETYVSSSPDYSDRIFSEKQLEHQRRVKDAAAYAKDASKQHPIYAQLAEGTVLSPYNVALSDWFKAPMIHSVERDPGAIRVRASDNVMVTKVKVAVLDGAGNVLVEGLAVQTAEDMWVYVTEVVGRVVAKAWDLAGNVTVWDG